MRKILLLVMVTLVVFVSRSAYATNYDMSCVEKYSASGFPTSADLPYSCDATDGFSTWFNFNGSHRLRFYWHDTLVWPRDYTEDSFTGGGDNIEVDWSSADLAVFSGHGSCQQPPNATSPDFIVTDLPGPQGPNFVNVGQSLRLGEFPGSGVFGQNGNLNTLLIDASCPMDLVSLTNNWWPTFQGLHVAMGHSGTVRGDTLNSPSRLPQVGMFLGPFPFVSSSYRTAWMSAGLIDVQSGVCAVITATGRTEAEAVARRDFETPTNRIGDAMPPSWLAWRWVCKG